MCALFRPGQDLERVTATLDTGAYLRYRVEADGGERVVRVDSRYDMGSSSCTVRFAGGEVTSSVHAERVRLNRVAAWVAAVGCVGLAGFQLLLALGAPLGRMAWGGKHARLPTALRLASLLGDGPPPFRGRLRAGAGRRDRRAGRVGRRRGGSSGRWRGCSR